MALIEWTDEFSVSNKELDAQHKRLFEYNKSLNEAVEANKGHEVIEEVLDSLIAYTHIHFKREEKLMEQHQFAEFINHKLQHEELVEEVLKLHKQYSKDNMKIAGAVIELLDKWLRDHILTQDKKYAKYLEN